MSEMTVNRLQLAIEQIVFARNYTLGLLDKTPQSDWFRPSAGGVSHIGWQVGHLAFAQYRLALWRVRGPRPNDERLISPTFTQLFGPKTVPVADPKQYPAAEEIRATLDNVHAQVLLELPGLAEAELDEAVPHPHPYAKTRFLALLWCAQHELLHAGQIGLLRRELGCAPIW